MDDIYTEPGPYPTVPAYKEPTMPDESWAIVELMGHVKLAGKLTEEEKFGTKMGRLDIPAETDCPKCGGSGGNPDPVNACSHCSGGRVPGFVTQYFGGGSVYRITYVTEEVARHVCKQASPAPVSPWNFPKAALAEAPSVHDHDDEERFDDEPEAESDY